MYEGFETRRIAAEGTEIALVTGGNGPPLLLLHGYPQTRALWHRVAARLAQRFTVVVPDMRGYGASGKPPTDAEHRPYSKRAMAADMVQVMAALGFERFDVAGHDRGARVTYRMALDHPQRVRRLAVLDVIPTLEQFERMDRFGSLNSYHWYFLARPAPFPETMIGRDPLHFLDYTLKSWAGDPDAFAPEALAEYRAAFSDPAVIHATCEDYRAGIGIDCEIDAADRSAGRKIAAPLLALWGDKGRPHKKTGVLETWGRWAGQVSGEALDCGHFLPEEAPDATAAKLEAFFASP